MKYAALFTLPVMLLAVMLPAGLGLSAMAAETGGHGDASTGGAPGTNVDMPYLMAPVTGEDGKLTGYAYISSRLTAASGAAVLTVREKLPFIQDAFVRDVNDHQVTPSGQPDQVDMPALEARLLADARGVVGAGKVKAITICTVQMAPLKVQPPSPQSAAQAGPVPAKSRCAN